ncbi:MAG: twin-arginine translocase TatA/TatE family subunit [Planctomycetes bacterium]|nr:twin-arginine translocase TatA/TatE family subunit [Planctomycetota bacterium]
MMQPLPLAFFSMPGGLEWIIIGLVALLLFGKRLPGVARSLGQALHEFKAGINGRVDAESDEKALPPQPPAQSVEQAQSAPVENQEKTGNPQ